MTPLLAWVANEPTPYLDYLFRTLAKQTDVRLKVFYCRERAAHHPWRRSIEGGYDAVVASSALGFVKAATEVATRFDVVVIGGWRRAFPVAVICARSVTGRRFALWTDTPDERDNRSLLKSICRSFWLGTVFRLASRVLATGSPAVTALVRLKCPTSKLVNFPYYIDNELFSPAADDPPHLRQILSCGRLDRSTKGFDTSVLAIRDAERRLGCALPYRILGEGRDRASLHQLARDVGLSLQLPGWVEGRALADEYRKARIFIHPATYEPYGVAVLEAMASGCLVIASDSTMAAVDRIRHGCNGFIYPATDRSSLTDVLIRVLQLTEAEQRAIRNNARATAVEWGAARAASTLTALIYNRA